MGRIMSAQRKSGEGVPMVRRNADTSTRNKEAARAGGLRETWAARRLLAGRDLLIR